jgi:hypothetical protein
MTRRNHKNSLQLTNPNSMYAFIAPALGYLALSLSERRLDASVVRSDKL